MAATPSAAGPQDRTATAEPRVCGFCGDKDPRWHGGHSSAWTVKDGLDRCPDCAWMQSGPDPQLEAARTDPRGLGDGLGS